MRIRTASQARRLRPIAMERARHSKMRAGDRVFFGGICYRMVTIDQVYGTKPYRIALLRGRNTSFYGPLTHVYPTKAEYEASGVHWNGPPTMKQRSHD